jgi:hypothetical protein
MKILVLFTIVLCLNQSAIAQTMNITYKTEEYSTRGLGWQVKAQYPQVDFGPDALMGLKGIASDINSSLNSLCRKMMNEFENNAKEIRDSAIFNQESQLDISSEAFVSGGSLLSVMLGEFSYYSGAAHPMTTVTTFNYSTIVYGEIDSMAKLFRRDSDYLGFISGYCNVKLKNDARAEGYDNIDDMIDEGTAPTEKNYRSWYVENDSLRIVFNPYQAGPYVMGVQFVPIALSDLIQYIDPKGPLEFMFR